MQRHFKPSAEDVCDVPWYFLNRILMLEYNGRNKLHYAQETNGQSKKYLNSDLR